MKLKLTDDTNPLPTFPDVLEPFPILKPFSSERKQNFILFLNFLYSNIEFSLFGLLEDILVRNTITLDQRYAYTQSELKQKPHKAGWRLVCYYLHSILIYLFLM